MDLITTLKAETQGFSELDALKYCLDHYADTTAFSTSLGLEDQVLTDMIVSHNKNIRFFTLDTGRLHPETYKIMEKTKTHFNIPLEVFFPKWEKVEALTRQKGLFSFFESVENRKECCAIRKLEPLARALQGVQIWITGVRRAQSVTRTRTELFEWDTLHQVVKINPLIEWTEAQVWDHVRTHKIPYNELYDKGYASIGCAPCTRAIKKGEGVRDGRWWWENPAHKECGLHPPK